MISAVQPLSRAAGYAAVFAAVLWFGLALLPAGIPFHVDTVRDLFLARNCAASDACLSLGPRSSAVFHHGFLWHRFLALFLGAGIPLDVLPIVLAVLHALSAALLYAAVERGAGRLTGLVAAALYCLAGFDRSLADPLWTPTSIPIFANAFAAAAALALLSDGPRRAAWAAAAALVLALGTQVHNELFLLLPGVLAFLFVGRRCGWRRPAALSAALLACLALAWAVFSRDSLLANWRLLWDFPAQAWQPLHPHRVTAAEALLFAGFAAAWAAGLLLRPWRPGREPELFFMLASGSYLLCFLPVFFTHESSLRYYAPVVPLLGLLWARFLGPVLERFRRSSALLLGLLALLAANRLHGLGRAAAPGLGSPLRLGEIHALAGAFAEQGCDASAMYRQSSGGQRAYLDFLSGLWLHAPCLRDEAVLGEGPPARERFAVVAVEAGRPLPSAARGLDLRRVAGSGRDFFIIRYEPWLVLDEFREVRGGRPGPARRTCPNAPCARRARRRR